MQRPSSHKFDFLRTHFYDFQPAILLANKRIYNEARHFLYNDNLFVIVRSAGCPNPYSRPMDGFQRPVVTQLAAKKDEIRSLKSARRISMHVDVLYRKEDLRNASYFVIAGHERPVFCKFLKQLDNTAIPGFLSELRLVLGILPSHQMNVQTSTKTMTSSRVVRNPLSLPEQRMLLEPFAILHSVRNVTIVAVNGRTKCLDKQLIEDVKRSAARSPDSMEEALIAASKIKDQGNEVFRAGNFQIAYEMYDSAWVEIRARVRDFMLESEKDHPLGSTNFDAHFLLMLRLLSNSAAAAICLQQWEAAHEKTTQAIKTLETIMELLRNLGREFICDPSEVATIYRRRSRASEGWVR